MDPQSNKDINMFLTAGEVVEPYIDKSGHNSFTTLTTRLTQAVFKNTKGVIHEITETIMGILKPIKPQEIVEKKIINDIINEFQQIQDYPEQFSFSEIDNQPYAINETLYIQAYTVTVQNLFTCMRESFKHQFVNEFTIIWRLFKQDKYIAAAEIIDFYFGGKKPPLSDFHYLLKDIRFGLHILETTSPTSHHQSGKNDIYE